MPGQAVHPPYRSKDKQRGRRQKSVCLILILYGSPHSDRNSSRSIIAPPANIIANMMKNTQPLLVRH